VFPEVNIVEEPSHAAQTAPRPQSAPKQPVPVGFGNPIALRIAFLMSIAIMVLDMIPFVQMLFIFWWLIAGWAAVRLYRRVTGFSLSPSNGARLGSITGVLAFLSLAVVMALGMLFDGKQVIQEMIRQNPQLAQLANSPTALALAVLVCLCVVFAMVVGFCAAGGALSARWAAGTPSK
jgi:hypothetical protein